MEERRKRRRNSRNKRAKSRKLWMARMFLILLFLICLLNIVWPSREFSEKENRMLEQNRSLRFPALRADGSWNNTSLTSPIRSPAGICGYS